MYQDETKKGLDKIQESISLFISRYYKAIITVVILFVVFLAGIGVLAVRNNALSDDSAQLAEEIEKHFSEWLNSEEDEQEEKAEILESAIERGISQYKGMYAHQRALFTKGHYLYAQEKYKDAAAAYQAIFDDFPKSYLAEIGLYNASACLEEAGDDKGAIELLEKLVEAYRETSPLIPQALFSKGRIFEKREQMDMAQETYQRLEDSYPSSNWTKLAKQRIIVMSVK